MKTWKEAFDEKPFSVFLDDLRLESALEAKWAEKLETAREMTLRGYSREEIIAILRVTPEEYINIENGINPLAAQA